MWVTILRSETRRYSPGLAIRAIADRFWQPRTISSLRACLPVGGYQIIARGAGGHFHRGVDVAAFATKNALEPVLLHRGEMPDKAVQAGPRRHTRSPLLLLGRPCGRPDHCVAHSIEEEQEHLVLGLG